MKRKARAYLFVGGGTGGHLYPALAIAERIWDADNHALIKFVCSDRAIDAEILNNAEVDFTPVPAKPIAKSQAGLSAFWKGWRGTTKIVRAMIVDLLPTHDVVIVAMGGFVSPPGTWVAKRLALPIVLINLDAIPGKANLLVARFAGRVCTALPVRAKNWEVVGPIVRRGASIERSEAHARFGLRDDKPTLLVTGGSQGAKSINDLMLALIGHRPEVLRHWQIIHQTGAGGVGDLAVVYERAGISAWVNEYIADMGSAWGAADLTIARCGAGTVAEAWASGVPGVFLPYPYHKDQHQKFNAQILVDAGAAIVLDDQIDPQLNMHTHGQTLATILGDPAQLESMREGFAKLGHADGAQAAAARIMGYHG